MINIAILGYGTVGSGVFQILNENKDVVKGNVGDEVRAKYVLDLRDFIGDPVQDVIVHDFEKIVSDPEIKVVVEVMGGINPAYDFIRASLESGKSVCTSNKELVEKHGTELLKLARDNGVNFLFEASVGGGIPIIRSLMSSLTADRIDEISGILNGTTNYMLSKMYFEGATYDDVLKEAQELGYAEAHPEADVEGYDACRKIAILTSIISGHETNFGDIHCEGITEITPEDMKYAKAINSQIKLVAMTKRVGDSYSPMVAPFIVEDTHPLFTVNGAFNSVFVKGNMLGDSMFYGSGAGKLPTASAVCGDIVEACKNLDRTLHSGWDKETLNIVPIQDVSRRFFVRLKGNVSDFKEQIISDFGDVKFIENIVGGEFAFITSEITEKEFNIKIGNYLNMKHIIRVL